jgi:hypothetical protein
MVNALAVGRGLQPLYVLPLLVLTGVLTLFVLVACAADWFIPEELLTPLLGVSAKMPTGFARILQNGAVRQARRQAGTRERKASSLKALVACKLPGAINGFPPSKEESGS